MARGFLAPFLGLLALTSAQKTYLKHRDNGKAITFQGQNGFSFALSASGDNGDLSFRMEGPSSYGWIGVGIGSQMPGALVFTAYASGDNNGVTVSQRIATGYTEPAYASNIEFKKAGRNKVISQGQTFVAEGTCFNCSTWDVPGGGSGSLDFTSTSQPFIYALGPDQTVSSTSETATLDHHNFHGYFAVDMTLADSTSAAVPSPTAATGTAAPTASSGSSSSSGSGSSGSSSGGSSAGIVSSSGSSEDAAPGPPWARWCHIIFGLFGLVIVFPAGAVWLRVVGSVRAHYLNNLLGSVCVVVGAGIGIWWSKQVDPDDHYKAPHQIVGLVILALTLLQVALGALHHALFKRSGGPTAWGIVHRVLGLAVICLGISQGFTGFNYSGEVDKSWPLAIVIIVWVGGCVLLVGWKAFSGRNLKTVAAEKRIDSPRSGEVDTAV